VHRDGVAWFGSGTRSAQRDNAMRQQAEGGENGGAPMRGYSTGSAQCGHDVPGMGLPAATLADEWGKLGLITMPATIGRWRYHQQSGGLRSLPNTSRIR
jgi:hypothetical protein